MKKPTNYKSYLKREIERIEVNLISKKYANPERALAEKKYLEYERGRKDRKKQGDLNCEFYGEMANFD